MEQQSTTIKFNQVGNKTNCQMHTCISISSRWDMNKHTARQQLFNVQSQTSTAIASWHGSIKSSVHPAVQGKAEMEHKDQSSWTPNSATNYRLILETWRTHIIIIKSNHLLKVRLKRTAQHTQQRTTPSVSSSQLICSSLRAAHHRAVSHTRSVWLLPNLVAQNC